jgi:3-oxoacyl-[acyl-carrier-protein] synthase II
MMTPSTSHARQPRALRRVAVTGIGLIGPTGNTTSDVWSATLAGRSGIEPITQFDASHHVTRFAGEVKGFDPTPWIDRKDLKKMARFIQFAVVASEEAMHHARLTITPEIAERVGVSIGSGIGGFDVIEREHRLLLDRGPGRVSPFFIPAVIVNLAAGWVSIRTGASGPLMACATACTTSAHSIGEAYRAIQYGDADAMIAGGSETPITALGVAGFGAMRALSTRNDAPALASRPWDVDRDGFVVGEGAGVIVLEEWDLAVRRGAEILAEIVGYGSSSDAYHITSPPEDGRGARRAMQAALRDAELAPSEIGYLNAHATSTPVGDRAEARAILDTFGDHARNGTLKVSATKSMTGHLLGGAGGFEAGLTVMALLTQTAPPTINLDAQDPEVPLDCVPHHAVPCPMRYALSNSFGFGGANASIIFGVGQR